jgi:hypothetical protein
VVIRPNRFTRTARPLRFYLNSVIGNPLETSIAALPDLRRRAGASSNLKILAVHRGGYLASGAGPSTAPGARAPTPRATCRIRRRRCIR